jgi:hypothetical protein
MMASVLTIAERLGLLDRHKSLAAYHGRCFDRPADTKALAYQCDAIERHQMSDVRYDEVGKL